MVKIVDALVGVSVNTPILFKTGKYQFLKGENKIDGDLCDWVKYGFIKSVFILLFIEKREMNKKLQSKQESLL